MRPHERLYFLFRYIESMFVHTFARVNLHVLAYNCYNFEPSTCPLSVLFDYVIYVFMTASAGQQG